MAKWKYAIARGKDFYGVTSLAIFKKLVNSGRVTANDMVYDFNYRQWIEAVHVSGMYKIFQSQNVLSAESSNEQLPLPRIAKSLKDKLKDRGKNFISNRDSSVLANPSISSYFDRNSESASYNKSTTKSGLLNQNGLAAKDYERMKSIRFVEENPSLFSPASPVFWGVLILGGLGLVGVLYKMFT